MYLLFLITILFPFTFQEHLLPTVTVESGIRDIFLDGKVPHPHFCVKRRKCIKIRLLHNLFYEEIWDGTSCRLNIMCVNKQASPFPSDLPVSGSSPICRVRVGYLCPKKHSMLVDQVLILVFIAQLPLKIRVVRPFSNH